MKLKASLEAVKSRKNVTDDILYSGVFSFFDVSPQDVAELTAHYKQPLIVTVEIAQKTIGSKS